MKAETPLQQHDDSLSDKIVRAIAELVYENVDTSDHFSDSCVTVARPAENGTHFHFADRVPACGKAIREGHSLRPGYSIEWVVSPRINCPECLALQDALELREFTIQVDGRECRVSGQDVGSLRCRLLQS